MQTELKRMKADSGRIARLLRLTAILLTATAAVRMVKTGFLFAVPVAEKGARLSSGLQTAMELLLWAGICERLFGVFRMAGWGGSPFAAENADRLRDAALCFAGISFLPGLVGWIAALALGTALELQFSTSACLWAILVYGLSKIFRYGCVLQKLEDETL